MIFFQNVLKDNDDSGWKRSLQRFRDSFETGKGLDCRERTAGEDLKGIANGEDWREKLGGWWW